MAKKPTVQNKQSPHAVIAAHTINHQYQGPIPPPDILRGFNDLVPGAAERLIKLAEDESMHRRDLEAKTLQANIENQQSQNALDIQQSKAVFRSDMIGQIAGFLVCILCIASATYLGVNNHEWLGGAIAAIPTGALIKAFALNKK